MKKSTNLDPYQKTDLKSLTSQNHNSAIGKECLQLISNINPLKDWPDPEKEIALGEKAESNLDLDVNNDDGNNLDLTSETGENESP